MVSCGEVLVPPLFFLACFTLHCSQLSEHLEQAKGATKILDIRILEVWNGKFETLQDCAMPVSKFRTEI